MHKLLVFIGGFISIIKEIYYFLYLNIVNQPDIFLIYYLHYHLIVYFIVLYSLAAKYNLCHASI